MVAGSEFVNFGSLLENSSITWLSNHLRNVEKSTINPSQNGQTTNQVRRHMSYYHHSFVSLDKNTCNLPSMHMIYTQYNGKYAYNLLLNIT